MFECQRRCHVEISKWPVQCEWNGMESMEYPRKTLSFLETF